jgi:hypothetical protein
MISTNLHQSIQWKSQAKVIDDYWTQAEREGNWFKDSRNAHLKAEIISDRRWEMEFYFKVLGLGANDKMKL